MGARGSTSIRGPLEGMRNSNFEIPPMSGLDPGALIIRTNSLSGRTIVRVLDGCSEGGIPPERHPAPPARQRRRSPQPPPAPPRGGEEHTAASPLRDNARGPGEGRARRPALGAVRVHLRVGWAPPGPPQTRRELCPQDQERMDRGLTRETPLTDRRGNAWLEGDRR